MTSTEVTSSTASSIKETRSSTSRPNQELLAVDDHIAALDAFLAELPAADLWEGNSARMIRVADGDAALVARQLAVHLESRGYTGESLRLGVLKNTDRDESTQELPGLAIMLATTGGLFGTRDDLVEPDGGRIAIAVWYAVDESDEQLDYLIGSEFSPESVGLTMADTIAISRSMSNDEFLLYFRLSG